MALPTETITVIKNGRIIGDLDMQGNQLSNLDSSNLPSSSGNDTGTTTAILKGDGDHGFANAVADSDYASPASVANKEPLLPTTTNDHYLLARRNVANSSSWEFVDPTSIGSTGNDTGTTTAILKGDGAHGFADAVAGTDYATPSALSTGLAAKEDVTSHNSDISTINGQITSINTSLTGKADASATTTALATKEPTLPTTANDAYVLARHNAGAGGTWYFVDPVTLGSTSATYADGATHSNTTFNSTLAVFSSNDTGKTIVSAGNIPAATTITFVNPTTVTLSNAATTTASPVTFTILNRYVAAGGGGTVTGVAVDTTTNVPDLLTSSVSNPTTSVGITLSKPSTTPAKTFYGNATGAPGPATFMNQAGAFAALDVTTSGKNIAQIANPAADSYVKVLGTAGSNVAQTKTLAEVRSDIGAESPITVSAPLQRGAVVGPNNISIPVVNASPPRDGYLTGGDYASFQAKVGPGRSFTTTAPITITSGAGGTLPVSGTAVDLSADRTIAMPAAASSPTQVSGYLTGADHAAFTAKVPTSRTLTTTAPLTISTSTTPLSGAPGSDLSANRVIAMPKADASTDGYLAFADYNKFAGGSANTVTPTGGITQGTWTVTSTSPPVTRVVLPSTLTGQMNIVLPSAANYGGTGYAFLEIVDVATPPAMTTFGIQLRVAAGQSLDGILNGTLDLPRGMGYLRLNGDGSTRWSSTKYFVDAFKDPLDRSRGVRFNIPAASAVWPTGQTRVLTPALSGDSVTVIPTDSLVPGVVRDINTDGSISKSPLNPTDLAPVEATIGVTGSDITFATFTVPIGGNVDTVRIAGRLTGPLAITWPPAGKYNLSETLTLLDASGTVSTSFPVTINATNPDVFNTNGVTQFVFDEANGRKALTSNGLLTGGVWSVSLTKTSVQPFGPITPTGSTFNLVVNANAGKQNAHLNLNNGSNFLQITNPYDGMQMELVVVQPAAGAAAALYLPSLSYVAGDSLGLVPLSSTNGAIDRLRGSYDALISAFLWDQPLLKHSTGGAMTAPSSLAASGITSSKVDLSWTDASNNETGFIIERNITGVAGGAYFEVGRVGPSSPPSTTGGTITFTDNTLTAGQTNYHFRVRAVNAGGQSAASNVVAINALAGGPTADLWELHFNDGVSNPTGTFNVLATVPPNATIPYSEWTTATKTGTGAAFNPTLGMAGMSGVTVTPTNGTGTTSYSYKVLAWKGTLHNAIAVAATTATGVPFASLTAGVYNLISWNAVTSPNADFYEVYRITGGAAGKIGGGPGFTATTLNDTGQGTSGSIPSDNATNTDAHAATAQGQIIPVAGTNIITISFWAKSTFTPPGAANASIITFGGNLISCTPANKFLVKMVGATGSYSCSCFNNVIPSGGSNAINSGTGWHNIVVIMDNHNSVHTANDILVYFDGVTTPQTLTNVGTPNNTGPFTFPAAIPVIGSPGFAGAIDDVRIFSGALTTTQITAIFTGDPQ